MKSQILTSGASSGMEIISNNLKDKEMKHRSDFKNKHHHSYSGTSKIGIGIVLILVGCMLVIRNTGFLPSYFTGIIFTWQMLLIAIGFVMTLGSGNRTAGLIVMAVGGFFILPQIFHISYESYRLFWPAIFIIIGVIILTNARFLKRDRHDSESYSSNDVIDMLNIFGGGERRVLSQNFRGGKVTSIFGGGEIDLTGATLAPGNNELEIACIFGGVSLIIPHNWNVILDVTPILGGFSDQRKIVYGSEIDRSKTLIIRGAVIFGGGELKSY